jgi:hypothetical protein
VIISCTLNPKNFEFVEGFVLESESSNLVKSCFVSCSNSSLFLKSSGLSHFNIFKKFNLTHILSSATSILASAAVAEVSGDLSGAIAAFLNAASLYSSIDYFAEADAAKQSADKVSARMKLDQERSEKLKMLEDDVRIVEERINGTASGKALFDSKLFAGMSERDKLNYKKSYIENVEFWKSLSGQLSNVQQQASRLNSKQLRDKALTLSADVESSLQSLEASVPRDIVVMDAAQLVKDGLQLLQQEKYSEAASCFRRASGIFADENCIEEEREARLLEEQAVSLLKEKQSRLAALKAAADEEERGKSCFILMQIGEAASAYKNAQAMFDAIGDLEGSRRCQVARQEALDAIACIKEKSVRIAKANELYHQGCRNIVSQEFGAARRNLSESLQLFEAAEHEPGAELAKSALETLEAKIQAVADKESLLAKARSLADIVDQMLARSKDHKLEDILAAINDAANAYEAAGESDLELAMRSQKQQLLNQANFDQNRAYLLQRAIDKEAIADAKYASSQFNDALAIYLELVADFEAVRDVSGVGRVSSSVAKCRRGLLVEFVQQNNDDMVRLALQLAAEEPEEWSDYHDSEVSVTSGSKTVSLFPSVTSTRAVSLVEAPPAVCCNDLWPMHDRASWDPAVSSFSVLEVVDEHSEVGAAVIDVGAAYEVRSLIIVRHKRMLSDGRFVMLEYSLPSTLMHLLYRVGSRNLDHDSGILEELAPVSASIPSGASFFGSLFRGNDEQQVPVAEPAQSRQPQIYLWAEIVGSVVNDFRSTVNVIRSADLLIGGGGLLGSVVTAMKSFVGGNPAHAVARSISLKYAKSTLRRLLHDADTLLSLGAFDESLQK